MLYSARRNAQNCTLGKLNSPFINKWPKWFERGVKETIQIKLGKLSLNRGGEPRHFLPPIYNAVPPCSTQQLKEKHPK